jgi:DNA-binding NarL/FixJ family response regulator
LVADSNQTQSQLLGSALRRQSGFRVVCCGSELSDCLHALAISPADVILLASRLANDSFEAVKSLHQRYPQTSLVLLLDSYDRDLVVNALCAGVRGLFCRASQPFKALCKCIHAVQQGQIWTNNELLKFVIDALTLRPTLHVTNVRGESLLTPREEQVLAQVAAGLPNRSIAQQLSVAESTVKKSLLRIFDKLGVSNRVELVLYALTRPDVKTQAPALQTPAVSGPPSRKRKTATADLSEMRNAPTNGDARPLD